MIVTVAASGIVTTLDIDRALAWQQALVFSGIVARVFSNPGCKQQPRIEGKIFIRWPAVMCQAASCAS